MAIPIPGTPPDWTPAARKVEKGEPAFIDVDNPGEWSNFVFRPEFKSTGTKMYVCHSLPTAAVPVPAKPDGTRIIGDWTFHYKGWNLPSMENRSGATKSDMFPDSRKGCLNADLLATMGLNAKRMKEGDALFFYHLLLPMFDPAKSSIPDAPRKVFYHKLETFSNISAFSIGLVGSYIY